ncbi:MAG: uroporphyrinogen-III synthase [Rickettsiales bacterium]|nr:uroporphyrinogen-III synthase [Rickettsiales bacterium]
MQQSILITRPDDQAQRIVQHLKNKGFEVFIEPTFNVEKISPDDLLQLKDLKIKKIAAIILTSSNAAEVAFSAAKIFAYDKNLKIFAVGKKTAEIFYKNGFTNINISEQNSAQSLLNKIQQDQELFSQKNSATLIYFCGESVTLDFKEALTEDGFAVKKIISYKIIEEENFSAKFLNKVKNHQFDFVLLYSKNSACHFLNLCQKHNLLEYFQRSRILCLSEKILSYLQNSGFRNSATFAEIPILKKFYD